MAIPNTISDNFVESEHNMVPPELMRKMQLHASKLRKQHPTWKPEKLARKVASHFNITILKGETSSRINTNKPAEADSTGQ